MKEENEAIIKALNMYGRVPEQWELLKEIERLKNQLQQKESIIREAREYIKKHITTFNDIFIPASESWYLLEMYKDKGD